MFTGRATSIAYVGPSVSPYYDLNLGYRIYYVDGDHEATTRVSYVFMDIQLWLFIICISTLLRRFPVSGGPRDMDYEFKGGQSIWVSDLVQAVLGTFRIPDGGAAAAGLGQIYRRHD